MKRSDKRHAARRDDRARVRIDLRARAEVLDQTDAARHRERAAVADRQIPRCLRELLEETRVGGDAAGTRIRPTPS